MDDNFDKCISYSEFRKALNDYKVGLTDDQTKQLFSYMDLNGNGIVEIDELVRVLQGEMNEFRTNLVSQAFKKLDKTGDGTLTINDIKGVYNAKNHPDVRSGKRTEDEVLGEFLETFELHHNLKVGMKDQHVSR
jgi:Ca2+-binding EF-hand superfamily protein